MNKTTADNQRSVRVLEQQLEAEKAAVEYSKSEMKRQQLQSKKALEEQKITIHEEHERAMSKLRENYNYAVC